VIHKNETGVRPSDSKVGREEVCVGRRERYAILSLFIGIAIIACSAPALAAWWIVRSSDKTCLVVDIEPKDVDNGVTKIGRIHIGQRKSPKPTSNRLCGSQGES